MVNYLKAIIYPFASKSNVLNTLVTAVVNLLWFLLFPFVFVSGYCINVMRQNLNDSEDMPSWKEFFNLSSLFQLLTDGTMALLIVFIYVLPSFILFFILTYLPKGQFTTALSFLSLFLLFLGLFLMPAALVVYASTSKIMSSINYLEVLKLVIHNLGTYLLSTVIFIVATVPYGFLTAAATFFLGAPMVLWLLFGAYIYSRSLVNE